MNLRERIQPLIKGDAEDSEEALTRASRDTSVFERRPAVVVSPKNTEDVAALVRFVNNAKSEGEIISLTGRSAGTDMSGGPLNDSIIVSFTKYMNKVTAIGDDYATVEPGMYYRDFEKETLAKNGKLLPSYPASRELCALGGIIANNSGGELTLRYGKTADYVRSLDVILSDGSRATFTPLTLAQVTSKKKEKTREGEIYRKMHALLEKHHDMIERERPRVSKNSAGYALWDVYNKKAETFDLTRLIVGSQGTLGLVTSVTLALAAPKKHKAMLVMFVPELGILPDIVHRVLAFKPESFESYDDHTFELAVKFLPQMLRQMGLVKAAKLGFAFLPEVGMALRGGIPKLILMAEFAEDSIDEARAKAREARLSLHDFPIETKLVSEVGAAKYWTIRRESFALLRKNLRGLYASPFIDDFVVDPDTYPRFLPALNALLAQYHLIYTIAGHVGNGNFHIIPLMDLNDPKARATILELSPKVYKLVAEYGGSTTGEHNDGIIRTPYLSTMFSPAMLALFAEAKKIFDPLNIFNPGKKVGGTEKDIEKYMMKHKI